MRKKQGDIARHEFKFAVWRNEADCSRRVKLVQPYTLVEAAIVEFNGVDGALLALVDNEFVVQAEFALWHARQICPHLYVAVDIRTEYSP